MTDDECLLLFHGTDPWYYLELQFTSWIDGMQESRKYLL